MKGSPIGYRAPIPSAITHGTKYSAVCLKDVTRRLWRTAESAERTDVGADSFGYSIGDGHGGVASATVRVTVVDVTPPAVTCPGNIAVYATSAAGAVVSYLASATDAHSLADFGCTPPPGSTFPVGLTIVTCTASDLASNVESCTFTVTVRPPNRAPVAVDDSATTAAGTAVTINVLANDSDPDGDTLGLSGYTAPAHGTIVRNADGTFRYTPEVGYTGPDSFTYGVTDGHDAFAEAKVLITVTPSLNACPVAVAKASPNLLLAAGQAKIIVIADRCGMACVLLDGSASTDADNDALTYSWMVDGMAAKVPSGVVVTNCLELGDHTITLVVDDGKCTANATLQVEVIAASEAVEELIAEVDGSSLSRQNKRPLLASLKAAAAAFDRENCESGEGKLRAFNNKVRALLSRSNAALAASLTGISRQIIDQVDCGQEHHRGHHHCKDGKDDDGKDDDGKHDGGKDDGKHGGK